MEDPRSKYRNMAEEYRDFFHVSIDEVTKELPKNKRKGPRGGVTLPFPARLYQMLESTQTNGMCDIVSWQEHGRCFAIHKPAEFASKILPRYFNQTKLTSFQRQLCLYYFQRIISGKDRGGYYHEKFLRGRPDIARLIVRTPVKGHTNSQTIVGDDPDLYSYTLCEVGKSQAKVAYSDEFDSSSETKTKQSTETKKRRAAAQLSNQQPPSQESRNTFGDSLLGVFPQAVMNYPLARLPTPSTSMYPGFGPRQPMPNSLAVLQFLAEGNSQARHAFCLCTMSLVQKQSHQRNKTAQLTLNTKALSIRS